MRSVNLRVCFPFAGIYLFSPFIFAVQFISSTSYSRNASWNYCQEYLQLGAAALCPDDPVPSAEDLADQILEVLNFFG